MTILAPTNNKKQIKQKFNIGKLLSDGATNSKTAKNDIKTFILYMAPASMNGKGLNLCPHSSAGCLAACLNTAGRGKFSNVQNARINKANFFVDDRKEFLKVLTMEILFQVKKAIKGGYNIAFRLNGTTDLDFLYLLKKHTNFDYTALNKDRVFFYDYTPNLSRAIRYKNDLHYTLTFSRKEDNEAQTLEAINQGVNVAAVFFTLPTTWAGVPVIDGDKNDLEMIKNKGVILGLKAKGDAKKDTSGFVIR